MAAPRARTSAARAIKLDQPGPYQNEIDLDFCKGCGLCAAECPCGAIEMNPEEI